jgi:hypothetical protein
MTEEGLGFAQMTEEGLGFARMTEEGTLSRTLSRLNTAITST